MKRVWKEGAIKLIKMAKENRNCTQFYHSDMDDISEGIYGC